MTNNTTASWSVVFDGPQWSSVFAWFSVAALVLWTVGTVFRWIWRKQLMRDPSTVVGACIVQFAVFIFLDTNGGLRSLFSSVHLGAPDVGALFLYAAQLMHGVLVTSLVGLACALLVCLVARRLPRIPLATFLPVVIATVDCLLSLQLVWMTSLPAH